MKTSKWIIIFTQELMIIGHETIWNPQKHQSLMSQKTSWGPWNGEPSRPPILGIRAASFAANKSGSHGGTSITMTWGPRRVLGTEFLSAKAISKMRLSIDGTNMEKTPFIDDLGVAFRHQWSMMSIWRSIDFCATWHRLITTPLSSISCKAFKISTADGRSLGSTAQQRSTRPGPSKIHTDSTRSLIHWLIHAFISFVSLTCFRQFASFMSIHTVSFHFISCHVISCLLISFHFVSSHVISFFFHDIHLIHLVPVIFHFINFNTLFFSVIHSFVCSVSQSVSQSVSHSVIPASFHPFIPFHFLHSFLHSVHFIQSYSSWIQVISFHSILFRVIHSVDFSRLFVHSFVSFISFTSFIP